MDKKALLENLAVRIQACKACSLYKGSTQAVPGEGNPNAKIFFIGEGPGFYEDKSGRPFVGPAGQLLERALGKVGIKREEVFIGNVVKHRPPENRDPLPVEIAACNGWLEQQLALIRPLVIVTLGRFSMAKFLPGVKISQVHGHARRVGQYTVIPMYHPAAALRDSGVMDEFLEDFENNREILTQPDKIDLDKNNLEEEDGDQIKLF